MSGDGALTTGENGAKNVLKNVLKDVPKNILAETPSRPRAGVPLAPQRRGLRHEDLVTVTDLAQDLGISARTLRFYEDKGLIAPQRVGAARVYSHRERARMILILRGKQLGFSIREIKTYLDLYDADPKHETQTRALLSRIAERRHQLEQKRGAIEQALLGLDDLERDARALLARVFARGEKPTVKTTIKPV